MSQTETYTLIQGDCIEELGKIPAGSVDSVCTDPPYALNFMGSEWDAPWKYGMSGFGFRDNHVRLQAPQFASARNPMCRSCHKHKYGSKRHEPCSCAEPDFDDVDQRIEDMRKFQGWCERWARECLRVLKPGGHLAAFGGTRTYHRLTCALEDAGFEIRDSISCSLWSFHNLFWAFGSGFPKSMSISKALDKLAGFEQPVVGEGQYASRNPRPNKAGQGLVFNDDSYVRPPGQPITEPVTPEARQWRGWGTTLKPAQEPIVLARKPIARGSVAANVLKHGTGALNVDACRVSGVKPQRHAVDSELRTHPILHTRSATGSGTSTVGRWPTNLVLTHSLFCVRRGQRQVKGDRRPGGSGTRPGGFGNVGSASGSPEPCGPLYGDPSGRETVEDWDCHESCPVRALDRQSGEQKSGTAVQRHGGGQRIGSGRCYSGHDGKLVREDVTYGDEGGASRFFPTFAYEDADFVPFRYCAKASRSERNAGLGDLPTRGKALKYNGGDGFSGRTQDENGNWTNTDRSQRRDQQNHHPTVKPIALMTWLVQLVTPPGGLVLDPFLGSGSTGVACVRGGFRFLGIELQPDYLKLARRRIGHLARRARQQTLFGPDSGPEPEPVGPEPGEPGEPGPLPLFAGLGAEDMA